MWQAETIYNQLTNINWTLSWSKRLKGGSECLWSLVDLASQLFGAQYWSSSELQLAWWWFLPHPHQAFQVKCSALAAHHVFANPCALFAEHDLQADPSLHLAACMTKLAKLCTTVQCRDTQQPCIGYICCLELLICSHANNTGIWLQPFALKAH